MIKRTLIYLAALRVMSGTQDSVYTFGSTLMWEAQFMQESSPTQPKYFLSYQWSQSWPGAFPKPSGIRQDFNRGFVLPESVGQQRTISTLLAGDIYRRWLT